MIGLCAPNGATFGLDWWADIRPSAVLVMEGQAGNIPAIRERLPNTRIYLRVEANGRAWDPPAHFNASEYAEYCAQLVHTHRPDCLVPWNEANVEWNSFGDSGGKEGYALLRDYARRFVSAYRSRSSVPVAFPALSPGHHEDDFEEYGKALAYSASLFDETHFHNYWTREPGSHLSEWWGQRAYRQIAVYKPTNTVVISEFNREFNPNDEADVRAYLKEIQEWHSALHPQVSHVLYFIADTDDPAFFKFAIKNNRTLVEGLRDIKETPVMADATIVASVPSIAPGGVAEVPVSVKKVTGAAAGIGILMGILHLPLRLDETAYTTDPVAISRREKESGKPNTDGEFILDIKLSDFPLEGEIDASLQLNWIGRDGLEGDFYALQESFPMKIAKNVAAPTEFMSLVFNEHYLFARLGDVANQAKENYDKTLAIVEELQKSLVNPK